MKRAMRFTPLPFSHAGQTATMALYVQALAIVVLGDLSGLVGRLLAEFLELVELLHPDLRTMDGLGVSVSHERGCGRHGLSSRCPGTGCFGQFGKSKALYAQCTHQIIVDRALCRPAVLVDRSRAKSVFPLLAMRGGILFCRRVFLRMAMAALVELDTVCPVRTVGLVFPALASANDSLD